MAEIMSILRRLLPLLITVMAVAGCSKPTEEERVIHIATASMVKTLDPALAEDLASRNMAGALYDTLLEYDYVKRPYCLKPSMLSCMPQVIDGGKSYRFTLTDDLYFVEDKCFAAENNSSESRKVRSSDVVFSLLRIADGKLHSPVYWLLRGKVKGIEEFYRRTGECADWQDALKLYDQNVEGFQILDDKRFIIHLQQPDPRFLYNLAIPYTGIVSEKAVRFYGQEALADHPVGSGPFKLASFRRNYQIVLLRN
jgi:ABC-type oligopeptide transport system substrate-binding subunit